MQPQRYISSKYHNLYKRVDVDLSDKMVEEDTNTTVRKNEEKRSQKSKKSNTKLMFDFDEESVEVRNISQTSRKKDFERIENLVINMQGWELLVRLVDKNYKEFVSKQGKDIKLLNLEFMDKDGWTIEGHLFGQKGLNLSETLQKGKIYHISKGTIQAKSFEKDKSLFKHSPLTIKFRSDSQFTQQQNTSSIPICTNNAVRLCQLQNITNTKHQINVIGILLDMTVEREIIKDNKKIIMRSLRIGDPVTQTVTELVIWNRQIEVSQSLLNRSLLLKKVRVNKYNGQFNLGSGFRSEVVLDPFFQEFQENYRPELREIGRTRYEEGQFKNKIRTIIQIEQEAKYLKEGQSMVSTINIWVKELLLNQKWFYSSCPNSRCKKAVSEGNRCLFCSTPVKKAVKRFAINVQLIDFTGIVTVIAFDESAQILMGHISIDYLSDLPENQLIKEGQRYIYNNFWIKLVTKKDQNKRLRHTLMGRPETVDCEKQIKKNLMAIEKLKTELESVFA